jgi:hypothetical protein
MAAAVGNRAFTALVQRAADAEASAPGRISMGPHPRLDPGTPAWAEDGEMVLGAPSIGLSQSERADVVHHEMIHALQQRMAPAEESGAARERAERLADRPRGDFPSPDALCAPAPRLLAAPIKGKAATGFDRLFGGEGQVIGEVVDAGVTVRISRSYADLGIEAPIDPNSRFGTASMTELQYLACGNRSFGSLEKTARKMRGVARAAARANGAIAAGSPWRVEQVFVVNEASRLHFADGRALITIAPEDFANAAAETAAHEASHAVFESHSHPDPGKPDVLAPDTLALRISDVFLRLSKTKPVPLPSKPFKKRKPSLKAEADDDVRPAGIVMVTDGLWSGGAMTDGHPWDGPDEFFASAYGAFDTDPALLREMIAHFAATDASIKQAGAELLTLLSAIKDSKAQKSLQGLASGARDAATQAIGARESPPSTIKQRLGAILDPEKLPPESVNCPRK